MLSEITLKEFVSQLNGHGFKRFKTREFEIYKVLKQ